ncbi:hypothetical protein HOY80DRAFT_1055639 [Tuber brumale]|nr:hypothetical protein HOY80DRAFT_1055639 [Tuber brumale]
MVEQVLRNRAAAQYSRELKLKELQSLEDERTRLAECNAGMRARPEAQLTQFEQFMGAAHNNNTGSTTFNPVILFCPTSLCVPPQQIRSGLEDVLLFLDSLEAIPVTTIDVKVLNQAWRPDHTEAMIA